MRFDAVRDLFSRLHVGTLHIHGTHTQLFVAEKPLVMGRHVMFDKVSVAIDLANEVRFVPPGVEIAVANLTIIIGPDCIIALAYVHHHVDVVGKSLDHRVDDLDSRADLAFTGRREVGLVDLNMLAAGRGQFLEILMQQLAEVRHHPRQVVVIFIIGNRGQEMRAGHGDLDGFTGKGRYAPEFVDKPEIDRVEDWAPANGGRVKDVWIVRRDRFGLGLTLERGNHVPEVIQHRVGRRVPVVRPAMHLPPGDDVYAGNFLFQNRGLARSQLCVGKIAWRQLAAGHQPVKRLVPSRNAVGTDHCGRVRQVSRHSSRFPSGPGVNLPRAGAGTLTRYPAAWFLLLRRLRGRMAAAFPTKRHVTVETL
jgi:hypothetical protein